MHGIGLTLCAAFGLVHAFDQTATCDKDKVFMADFSPEANGKPKPDAENKTIHAEGLAFLNFAAMASPLFGGLDGTPPVEDKPFEMGAVHQLGFADGNNAPLALNISDPANVTAMDKGFFQLKAFKFFCGEFSETPGRDSYWTQVPCKILLRTSPRNTDANKIPLEFECGYGTDSEGRPSGDLRPATCVPNKNTNRPIQALEFHISKGFELQDDGTPGSFEAHIGETDRYFLGIDKFEFTRPCGSG